MPQEVSSPGDPRRFVETRVPLREKLAIAAASRRGWFAAPISSSALRAPAPGTFHRSESPGAGS